MARWEGWEVSYSGNTAPWDAEISQLASCHGKEKFASSAAAKKTIKRIEKRKHHPNYCGSHKARVEAYKCVHCSGWHIGRTKRDAKR